MVTALDCAVAKNSRSIAFMAWLKKESRINGRRKQHSPSLKPKKKQKKMKDGQRWMN
jgi:hypothetical protein